MISTAILHYTTSTPWLGGTAAPSQALFERFASHVGLPVVIWGPEYCSELTWSRGGERALCVTDPNPTAMRQTLEELAASPLEQERLSKSAREAAVEDSIRNAFKSS